MKKIKIILLLIVYMLSCMALSCVISLVAADYLAYSSAINEEYLDLYELAIREDYDCQIKTIDSHSIKKGKVTYLCVKNNDETNTFIVVLELKNVAPFRYEWVEVEL